MIRERKKKSGGGDGGPSPRDNKHFPSCQQQTLAPVNGSAWDEPGKTRLLTLVGLLRFDRYLRDFNVSLKRRGRPLPAKQKWHCQREREDGQATPGKGRHDEKTQHCFLIKSERLLPRCWLLRSNISSGEIGANAGLYVGGFINIWLYVFHAGAALTRRAGQTRSPGAVWRRLTIKRVISGLHRG